MHTVTTEIYTLSLHDALPICNLATSARWVCRVHGFPDIAKLPDLLQPVAAPLMENRSEEHTSELQSHSDLVCRLLLEKKKNNFRHVDISYAVLCLSDKMVSLR